MAVAMGFAACEDDTEPRLSKISDGTLDEALVLTMESDPVLERNNASNNALRLAWTLPEYSVAIAQSVEVQASLTEDFATTQQAAVVSGETYTYLTVSELNALINNMMEVTSETGAVTVYFRAIFGLNDDEDLDEISNTVSISVTPYPSQSVMYLIGSTQGWDITASDLQLTSSDGVTYQGTFTLEDGAQFRFYSALGDWESNSYGSQEEDAGINITSEFVDGVYEGTVVVGKGTWIIDNGGEYTITLNISDMTIRIEPGITPSIYLIGSTQGWSITDDSMPLICTTGDDVYVGVFELEAGAQFRFYTELGDWDSNSYGSQEEDAGINITSEFVDGVYEGTLVVGKGTWIIDNAGTYTLTVDMANMTVSFEAGGELSDSNSSTITAPTGLFVIGEVNGWSMDADATGALTEGASNVWSGTFTFPEASSYDPGYSHFYFVTTLDGSWDASVSIGSASADSAEYLDMSGGYAETSVLQGSKVNFVVPVGTYTITVDLNNNVLAVEPAE